jgi:hypothetical protein
MNPINSTPSYFPKIFFNVILPPTNISDDNIIDRNYVSAVLQHIYFILSIKLRYIKRDDCVILLKTSEMIEGLCITSTGIILERKMMMMMIGRNTPRLRRVYSPLTTFLVLDCVGNMYAFSKMKTSTIFRN